MTDDMVSFASREYVFLLALLVAARGADLLSTWVATPHLVLEGNPIARWLGWKWGLVVNGVVAGVLALWPLSALVVVTASVLVAARNFQSAWLMRTLGEEAYREWYVARLLETPPGLLMFCLAGQTLLPAAVGGALILFSGGRLVPLSIGLGVVAYAAAVLVFTLVSLWRIRRRRRYAERGL